MGRRSEDHLNHEVIPLTVGEADLEQSTDRSVDYFNARQGSSRILIILLSISIVLNIVLATRSILNGFMLYNDDLDTTKFAGLQRNIPKVFNSSSSFGLGTANETTRSILWESLDTSAGEISLDNQWAAVRGLPNSTQFFWDHERSIYLLNAHHSLHCLRKVRRSVTLAHYNLIQVDSYPHLVHCMDHLLQNIICEADDTPMYTSPKQNATTGLGQQRMCRSWDKLTAWAENQSACFGYINETQGVDAVIQRFRYCRAGSASLEPMRRFFGYENDWYEPRPADIETLPHYWDGFNGF